MIMHAEKTIHMIGDSTMDIKPVPNEQNERGWGQILVLYTCETVSVANHAKSGSSSRSFIDEGLWTTVKEKLRPDDWLIIQFGHNDCKPDKRYTDPFTTYSANLEKYVKEGKEAGVYPIICTSIVRGNDLESHGDYPRAARNITLKHNIPLIDLEMLTKEYIADLQNLKDFYIQKDNTHLNESGAVVVCRMAVNEIHRQNLPLSKYLKH
jgi:lysophospholipase L1-like esterase